VDGCRRREIGINGGGSLRKPRPTEGCSEKKKKKEKKEKEEKKRRGRKRRR